MDTPKKVLHVSFILTLCIASVAAPSIDLRGPGKFVYLGKEAVFTCKVTTNGTLIWTSDNFIGPYGMTLSFPSNSPPGSRMSNTLHPNNYAFLKSVNNDAGIPELTSTFHAQVEGPIGGRRTVTCRTTDGLVENATVQILDLPGEPGRNFTVVNATGELGYFLNISWEALPGPVEYYVVEYNDFNRSTNSTEISIPVSCGSTYYIYVTAIGPYGVAGPRVRVAVVNSSVCDSSGAMVTRANGMVVVAIGVVATVLGNMEEFRRMLALCTRENS